MDVLFENSHETHHETHHETSKNTMPFILKTVILAVPLPPSTSAWPLWSSDIMAGKESDGEAAPEREEKEMMEAGDVWGKRGIYPSKKWCFNLKKWGLNNLAIRYHDLAIQMTI